MKKTRLSGELSHLTRVTGERNDRDAMNAVAADMELRRWPHRRAGSRWHINVPNGLVGQYVKRVLAWQPRQKSEAERDAIRKRRRRQAARRKAYRRYLIHEQERVWDAKDRLGD